MGVACAAFSPDARSLATANGDGVRLWNVTTGEELTALALGSAYPRLVRFSADGRRLAAITFDPPADGPAEGTLRLFIWDGVEEP
jgi:WD40 repeat protein